MATLNKLYLNLKKISDCLQRVLETIAAFLIIVCSLALLFQVFYRFIIIKYVSFSFPFTEEIAKYALIWSVYLMIGICLKEGSQASVNLIYDRLGYQNKCILYYITRLIMAIFLAVTIYYAIYVVKLNVLYKSPTLRLSGVYLYSAPLVGCILLTFETFIEVLGVITRNVKPFNS
ncbi:MAG: TRAP transporter small permease subunit [Clostridiales bacterium]|nr:TRAP transporter small permease subunit [Clostridiales bacterium]